MILTLQAIKHNIDECVFCSLLGSQEYASKHETVWEVRESVPDAAAVNASLKAWTQELENVPPKAKKEPGNREREAIFQALVSVEKALDRLPEGHGQVAGYLQAFDVKGGKSGEDNALAQWLGQQVLAATELVDSALYREIAKVHVWVEVNGIILETPKYQVAIDPMPWQEMFMLRLRQGDFKELLSS